MTLASISRVLCVPLKSRPADPRPRRGDVQSPTILRMDTGRSERYSGRGAPGDLGVACPDASDSGKYADDMWPQCTGARASILSQERKYHYDGSLEGDIRDPDTGKMWPRRQACARQKCGKLRRTVDTGLASDRKCSVYAAG